MPFGVFRGPLSLLCVFLLAPHSAVVYAQAQQAEAPKTEAPKIPNDQLDSLVAPIALYPDPLLAQMLAASTYPLEVIQLQQWLLHHKDLKDKALVAAVEKQDWDPSIQGLAALPDAVKQLAENIKWTTDLGNAFLAQQSDVMDAVQRMRMKAQGAGNLKSTEQQKVETKVVENKTVVVIEQANPQVVYVPSYNPVVVYGPPVYPYPPIVYPPVGAYVAGAAIGFGVGIAMGAAWGGGWGYNAGWGGGNNNININNNNSFVNNSNRNTNVSGGTQYQQRESRWEQQLAAQRAAPRRRSLFQSGDGQQVRRHHSRGVYSHPAGRRSTKPRRRQQPGSMDRGNASSRQQSRRDRAGASSRQQSSAGNRAGASSRQQPSAASRGGGSDRIGNRSVSSGSSSRGGGAFGGGGSGYSGSSARASSSRGSSSMGSRGGGEAAAAGGGGRQAMIEDKHMRSNIFCIFTSKALLAIQVAALSCALATLVHAAPQSKPTSAAASATDVICHATIGRRSSCKGSGRLRRSRSDEHPRTRWPGFSFVSGRRPG